MPGEMYKASSGKKPHLLRATILLSVFELMYDASGNGFVAHFVHGTTALAHRVDDPRSVILGRSLYDTVKIFELTRAFNFWGPTFLEQSQWRTSLKRGSDQSFVCNDCETPSGGQHPLDEVFDLGVDLLAMNAR